MQPHTHFDMPNFLWHIPSIFCHIPCCNCYCCCLLRFIKASTLFGHSCWPTSHLLTPHSPPRPPATMPYIFHFPFCHRSRSSYFRSCLVKFFLWELKYAQTDSLCQFSLCFPCSSQQPIAPPFPSAQAVGLTFSLWPVKLRKNTKKNWDALESLFFELHLSLLLIMIDRNLKLYKWAPQS